MIQDHRYRKTYPNTFISAAARQQQLRQCFQFGIPQLDDVVELYPGSLSLIQGELPRAISRFLLTQLTVSLLSNNPGTDLAFVDGANVFPYYNVSLEAKKRGLDPLAILDRIQLARAFNYHQVTEILTKKLPKLINANPKIRIILVPQISSLYLSKEALQYLGYDKLTATSSILELTQALGKLKSLTIQYDLIGLMTAENAPRSRKPLGGTYFAHAATDIIRVEATSASSNPSDYTLLFTVQKGGAPVQAALTPQPTGNQPTPLTEFW
ncbi:MAG: hypothetical protein ACXAC8_03025 [Candidatus Hodarchaeales archaeon]|jgi:hypothetical protein